MIDCRPQRSRPSLNSADQKIPWRIHNRPPRKAWGPQLLLQSRGRQRLNGSDHAGVEMIESALVRMAMYEGPFGRRYQVCVQPDLFGGYSIIRSWSGRNSKRGGMKMISVSSPEECARVLDYIRRRRRQHGYVLLS